MLTFPLGQGHYYGPYAKLDLQCHSGRDDTREHLLLMEWQKRADRQYGPLACTGFYDGPTQRAIINLQNRNNIPATGLLNRETWEALWSNEPTEPEPVELPPAAPPAPPTRGRGRPKKTPQPS